MTRRERPATNSKGKVMENEEYGNEYDAADDSEQRLRQIEGGDVYDMTHEHNYDNDDTYQW